MLSDGTVPTMEKGLPHEGEGGMALERCMILLVILLLTAGSGLSAVPSTTAQGDLAVTMDYPRADEIVAGLVEVRGTATGAEVVDIKVDAEENWHQANGSDRWSYSWDTIPLSDSSHILFLRARNGTSTSEVVSRRVYVNNTPPEFISMDVSVTPGEIDAGGNITVSGILEYDTGVKVMGETAVMEIDGTGLRAEEVTDQNGFFSRQMAGPGDAGDYVVRVSVNDGNITETMEFDLKVTSPFQPDLTISRIELNPVEPTTEDTVEIYATVENVGNKEGTGKVRFYIDDELKDSKSATVRKTETVETVWIARAGEHVIKVTVSDVEPTERNTTNNELSMKVVPRSVPDVEIVEVATSNPSPHEGQEISIMVRLENRGEGGTTGTLRLFNGPPADDIEIAEKDFSIEANGTTSVYVRWKPRRGTQTLYATVDVVDQPEDPAKHVHSTTISVLPPEKREEDTPGFDLPLVLCAVLVTLFLFRGSASVRWP